jgi:Asp-tRNA(Asn)/Glu-tRNA(Gln) amidotransferase A subunit family amidase
MLPTFEPVVKALRDGTLSLDAFLETLEQRFDRREGEVRAFLPEKDRFGRLRREAAALQERYPHPAKRPPLFGLPVGVKDIFHVAGTVTRAGATLPEELLQGSEAKVVTQLKEAGALICGKTETTEFAYFAPGPTRNPHDATHTPGGSSSGSAAAVGAGLCPVALGTQTIGSITRPAAYCGVLGYKPSYDRLSREGVIPLSPSLDHVGLFAWSLADLTTVASALIADWETTKLAAPPVLGIPGGPYLRHASAKAMDHLHETCDRALEAGIEIKLVDAMADFEAIVRRHQQLMAAEAAAVHAIWYASFADRYHPKTAELIRRGQEVLPEEVVSGREGRAKLRAELEAVMEAEGVDLWVSPSAPGPAPGGLESTGDPIMNLPWTHSGMPTLNLPTGLSESGLPLGCQLAARFGADEALLAWARVLVDALQRR